MKNLLFFLTAFSTGALACISDPVYVDVEKIEKNALASGRNIIIQSSDALSFPTVEGLKFHPRTLINLSGKHQYEVRPKVELSRDYKFELTLPSNRKINLHLHIPPLLQGDCLNLDGVKYN